jgi:type I site-specific restriction endonuclease
MGFEYPLDDDGRAGYASDWNKTIVFAATKRHAKTLATAT